MELAADYVPGGPDERLLAERGDGGGHREAVQEGEEPLAARAVEEALGLREVERKVVGLDAVQDLRLGPRDRLVGHRQLLDVVDPVRERVVVGLRRPDPQHVQDHLRVLGVVLVPAVVQRLAGAGQGHGRDQPDVEAGVDQAPGQGARGYA